MKPDRIKPFVSCLLGRLKENTEGPCGWGSQQDGLCIHLINQLAEGKERREVHVINTCFSLAFFPQKTGLEWHPQESPPSHPRHAGGLRGCSCDPPAPTPAGALALVSLGPGEMSNAGGGGGRGGSGRAQLSLDSISRSLPLPSNLTSSYTPHSRGTCTARWRSACPQRQGVLGRCTEGRGPGLGAEWSF